MIQGKTKSGFEFEIPEETFDDYELLEAFHNADKGNPFDPVEVFEKILDKEKINELKEHLRDKDGKVKISAMSAELQEIMNGSDTSKNS